MGKQIEKHSNNKQTDEQRTIAATTTKKRQHEHFSGSAQKWKVFAYRCYTTYLHHQHSALGSTSRIVVERRYVKWHIGDSHVRECTRTHTNIHNTRQKHDCVKAETEVPTWWLMRLVYSLSYAPRRCKDRCESMCDVVQSLNKLGIIHLCTKAVKK